MADSDAYLIDVESQFGYSDADIALSAVIDAAGFFIEDPVVQYGSPDISIGGSVNSPAYLIPDPEVFYSAQGLAAIVPSDAPMFLIDFMIIPGQPGDNAFLFDFQPPPVPTLSGNSMTEIIYPVVPVSEVNKVLFRLDSEEIRVTTKSAAQYTREVDTIRFRVDTAFLAAFLATLDTNRLVQFRLQTPGYTPFGGTSEDNYVRVLSRGRPQREERGLTQLVDVTFRFMATFP